MVVFLLEGFVFVGVLFGDGDGDSGTDTSGTMGTIGVNDPSVKSYQSGFHICNGLICSNQLHIDSVEEHLQHN